MGCGLFGVLQLFFFGGGGGEGAAGFRLVGFGVVCCVVGLFFF